MARYCAPWPVKAKAMRGAPAGAWPRCSRAASPCACYKLFVLLADTFAFLAILELAVRTAARSSSDFASTAAGLELVSVLGGAFLYQVVQSNPPAVHAEHG